MNIKIKKGLDLPLDGAAVGRVVDVRASATRFAVRPTDIVGFTPRLLVAEGDTVRAGQALVCDKKDERVCLPSPVDGTVVAVVRGEKRRLLAVVVERSQQAAAVEVAKPQGDVKSCLMEGGAWWMLRERPFGAIANPDHQPKGIFVSMVDTNPLAPDVEFALKGREHDFEAGLQALATMAPVHLCVAATSRKKYNIGNLTTHTVEGPHPAGNVGTQIAQISPINKGECVWTVGAQDVATIGRLIGTGVYSPERVITVAGPAAKNPKYYRVMVGSEIGVMMESQLMDRAYPGLEAERGGTRIVSGSVLSGTEVEKDGFMTMYDQQITLLPEGDQYEFMGWLMPGLDKFSVSKTFLSGHLLPFGKLLPVQPHYKFNTNMHGSVRPYLFTGNFERVFPFDIYPLQLIKACVVGDMELQEQLGIYEVEPEDFALCEFVDTSKTEIQTVVREALEKLRKEANA